MKNYVIVDTNIGFIQWVGKAATPLDAVNAFDKDTGWTANNEKPGFEKVEFPRGQRHPDELIVREAPTSWDCGDGGDQDKIDEAESFPIAGVFQFKAEEDTE